MRRRLAPGVACVAALAVSGCSAGFAGSPTYVTDVSATINGLIATTNAATIDYWAEYSTDKSYNHQSTIDTRTVPAKSSFLVSIPIAGLSPNTTYHYRVCAERCSDDATFKTDAAGGRSGIAFSSNRGLGNSGNASDIIAMAANGSNPTDLTNSTDAGDQSPTWSPDARRIAFTRYTYDDRGLAPKSAQIYVMNANGTDAHALTGDAAFHDDAAWSPDGKRIVYERFQPGSFGDLFVMDADGSNQHNLTNSPAGEEQPSWSPDGTRIVFDRVASLGANPDLYVMNAGGGGVKALTNTPNLGEGTPAWSPDGRLIAYTADVGGSLGRDVFVIRPEGGTPVDVTERAGNEFSPSWSPDGSKIAMALDNGDIAVLDAPRATPVKLTSDAFADAEPVWSPRP